LLQLDAKTSREKGESKKEERREDNEKFQWKRRRKNLHNQRAYVSQTLWVDYHICNALADIHFRDIRQQEGLQKTQQTEVPKSTTIFELFQPKPTLLACSFGVGSLYSASTFSLRFLFTFLVLHGRRISRKDKKGPKGQT
jgi:hypothetical protein